MSILNGVSREFASQLRKEICLNGWWDFLPVHGEPGHAVPSEGWIVKSYLTPSFWTKPTDAVRKKGATCFGCEKEIFRDGRELGDYEFLFDAFGYPAEWSRTRNGWIRRSFEVPALESGRRQILRLDAVTPNCRVYINGFHVGRHRHPTLPFEADITQYVKTGSNELAVLVIDYEKDERGRALSPSGNWIPEIHSGIWQDVFLCERADLFLAGVAIRTSVRQSRIEIIYEFRNDSNRPRKITVKPFIGKWAKGADPLSAESCLEMPEFSIDVPACGTAAKTLLLKWASPELWSPESPNLYNLATALFEDGKPVDLHVERFGFREVWVDGPDFILNGHPIHLFSDWGHKTTPYYYTEAWIRQWFGMIRDANMNHSRLHTHPHPRIYLDLADEEGILITGEAGIHGSGGHQGSDSMEYWEAAADHIRRFVRRDRNHPCIVMWSVENEMRWNNNKTSLATERLPLMRRLFNELDPTRIAYHEGDSSLWDERKQPVISRHYAKPCSGYGWWDRSIPLHVGEMSLYHLSGPNNTAHLGGDAVWSSFKALDEAAALDTAYIIETGRTLGVCCFGPWNLSCLENLRMETEPVKLDYKDWGAPGVKPIFVQPHSSELSFWKPGKSYTPNYSFPIQANAFRPLAVIDRSRRSGYYAGGFLKRELFVVNDTVSDLSGILQAALIGPDGLTIKKASFKLKLKRGRLASKTISFNIPDSLEGVCRYTVSFVAAGGAASDSWDRTLRISARSGSAFGSRITGRIAVLGTGSLRKTLERLGLNFAYVDDLQESSLRDFKTLIMEKGTVCQGSVQNRHLRDFAANGGRALVMEQGVSLFKGLPIESKPLQTQFVRAPFHPVFNGLSDSDFAFWGNDPYPMQGGDNYVAESLYVKDDSKHTLFLLDGDEGGFGNGGLAYSGLVEIQEGAGVIIASQLSISDKIDSIPAAERLFLNILQGLDAYVPSRSSAEFMDGTSIDASAAKRIAEAVRNGGTMLVEGAGEGALSALGSAFGIALKPVHMPDEYQAVRVKDDPVLAGVSNEDCSGVDTFTYSPPTRQNFKVGSLFIEPANGLEPLLATATESCLKELHVLEGRSEPLRAHTQSRFLHAERPRRAIVLGRLAFGSGQLLLSQFVPEDPKSMPRLSRLANRLRANLGLRPEGGLLDAPLVEVSAAGGPGYPERVAILNGNFDKAFRNTLTENTKFFADCFSGQPILTLAKWERFGCKGGEISAKSLDVSSDIYLFFALHSPTRRKDLSSNLGVPNPDALSFLDLDGDGSVEFILDGAARPVLELEGGRGTVSDIPLDQGMNNVLLRWIPSSKDATLRLRWRDIKGQPERGFVFQVN